MKKLLFVFVFMLFLTCLFSNRFWNHRESLFNIESILSYSPSVANYAYEDKDKGYYFSDSIDWQHMFNLWHFQFGTILNYRFGWAMRSFIFSNQYRLLGLQFDCYNLSFMISLGDIGFSVYKYGFWNKNKKNHSTIGLLFNPITTGISYRMNLNQWVDGIWYIGYSISIMKPSIIYLDNVDEEFYYMLEHNFKCGFGFRFYTRH